MTILHLDPNAPAWMRESAVAVLYLHIGGGGLGIASGTVAVIARKGERLHRAAGNVFFAAMLTMSATGAVVAPLIHHPTSMFAGLTTFYLTATAWAAVKRGEGRIGGFERAAFAAALVILALGAAMIWNAAPGGTLQGEDVQPIYLFGLVVAIAAAGDLRMIANRGIAGAARIARHLWRMCFAFFIATSSFFLGQQKVLPAVLHGPWLFIPAFAPLALMLYWLIRVRWTGRRAQMVKNAPVAKPARIC